MVHVIDGNLLESDCTVIGHQCNCQGVMGSGIALQVKQQLPGAYRAFAADRRRPEEKLGSLSVGFEEIGRFSAVFNLYGQLYYGRDPKVVYTRYPALKLAINQMLSETMKLGASMKVGLPFNIGCGLANGDWPTVLAILEGLSTKHGIDIHLYRFEK